MSAYVSYPSKTHPRLAANKVYHCAELSAAYQGWARAVLTSSTVTFDMAVKHETIANPLDVRAWLRDVEALGELKEVRGADWNLELGAISELNVNKEKPPALLFDEITGYQKGFRVLTCSTSSPSRLSSILRLLVQATHKGLVQQLRGKPGAWQSEASTYKPVFAENGPVFENSQKGAQVDLATFPAPFWH